MYGDIVPSAVLDSKSDKLVLKVDVMRWSAALTLRYGIFFF